LEARRGAPAAEDLEPGPTRTSRGRSGQRELHPSFSCVGVLPHRGPTQLLLPRSVVVGLRCRTIGGRGGKWIRASSGSHSFVPGVGAPDRPWRWMASVMWASFGPRGEVLLAQEGRCLCWGYPKIRKGSPNTREETVNTFKFSDDAIGYKESPKDCLSFTTRFSP
jgi:hypothetical protein